MHRYRTVGAAAVLATAALALAAGPAAAAVPRPESNLGSGGDAVFVQSDNPAANTVVAYERAADGSLTPANTYATGGLGGVLAGSVVDHLASQGSLVYDRAHQLLIAVNAGSNTISVFAVHGSELALVQILGSGGSFPVSVAVHGNLVYVLNALEGGSLQGYSIAAGRLLALPDSRRSLGLNPTATPQFVNTPGQLAFTPDGERLIVTTKANGNDIDVFGVDRLGLLSPTPVVNAEPGAVPFAVAFDAAGHIALAEAGPNAVATFALRPDGTVEELASVATGQAATCWVAVDGSVLFASNAGAASVSSVSVAPWGALTLLATTSTDGGTVDAATSADGRFLYVQTGAAGLLDAFRVGPDGSLSKIGSVTVPDAVGGEGIAAS
jgi:6-phosphogluconolactonase (cycloisomerase 2 family)